MTYLLLFYKEESVLEYATKSDKIGLSKAGDNLVYTPVTYMLF